MTTAQQKKNKKKKQHASDMGVKYCIDMIAADVWWYYNLESHWLLDLQISAQSAKDDKRLFAMEHGELAMA